MPSPQPDAQIDDIDSLVQVLSHPSKGDFAGMFVLSCSALLGLLVGNVLTDPEWTASWGNALHVQTAITLGGIALFLVASWLLRSHAWCVGLGGLLMFTVTAFETVLASAPGLAAPGTPLETALVLPSCVATAFLAATATVLHSFRRARRPKAPATA